MIWAGQNKDWSSIEEATEFWLGLGVQHIMIKHDRRNFQLISPEGRLVTENLEKLSRLKQQYNVEYHFHPYNLSAKGVFLTPSIREAHPILHQFLKDLDQAISDYGFYPLIILHPPFLTHPKHQIKGEEEELLELGREFTQSLELRARVALETIHDPYKNKMHLNENLLGYKPGHFTRMIGDKPNIGICIDIGHLNMAETPMNAFLELKLPIYSVHLHGNDGEEDQHILPNAASVKDIPATIQAIKMCQGPVALELLKKYNYSGRAIREYIAKWNEAVKRIT